MDDAYAAAAGAYDLFDAGFWPARRAALEAVMPRLRPEHGPIVDIGAGSGSSTVALLEGLAEARVFALEPSPAMRSLLIGKIAARPEWFERVTVRPEDFFSATLPERIGGAILFGVLGHFDPGERAAVFAELAARLPPGGIALIDLRLPDRPQKVDAHEFTATTVGELSYRVIAQAWPVDGELMRWRMSYLTLDGERVVIEDTVEFEYRHPAVETVVAEAKESGLAVESGAGPEYFILTRKGATS